MWIGPDFACSFINFFLQIDDKGRLEETRFWQSTELFHFGLVNQCAYKLRFAIYYLIITYFYVRVELVMNACPSLDLAENYCLPIFTDFYFDVM